MFQPNYIYGPVSIEVQVEASSQWYEATGDDKTNIIQGIINNHSGVIHGFLNSQMLLSRGKGFWGKEYKSDIWSARFVNNNGQMKCILTIKPENDTSQGTTINMSDTYLVDIPFAGYPVAPNQVYGINNNFSLNAQGGTAQLGLPITTEAVYFEVEVKKLPSGVPPSTFVAGDASHDGLTITTDVYKQDTTGTTWTPPDDLTTFCTPYFGVAPGGVGNPNLPNAGPVKGTTSLGGGFTGSGGYGFPRSIVAFPTQCRMSSIKTQTYTPPVYYLGNAHVTYQGLGGTFVVPWMSAYPGAKNNAMSYSFGGTIGDEFIAAYTTPAKKAQLVLYSGIVTVKNLSTLVVSSTKNFKWDGSDFPITQLQSAWYQYLATYSGNPSAYTGIPADSAPAVGIGNYVYLGAAGTTTTYPIDLGTIGYDPGSFNDINLSFAVSVSFTISKIPSQQSTDSIANGLILGDVFTGPAFIEQDYLDSWEWGVTQTNPIVGSIYYPDLIKHDQAATNSLDGPNAPGVHCWVIKGKPTSIGNLSGAKNDLPVNNLAPDQYGNQQDASGVWTGVDIGPIQVNDILMVAVKPKTKTSPGGVWFGKNGTWKGHKPGTTPDAVLDDLTPLGGHGAYLPVCGAQWGPTQLLFRFGQSTKFSPPSGFTPYGVTTISSI